MNYGLSKSAQIVLTNSIFYVKNWRNFFKKRKNPLRISILETIFCKKKHHIFPNFNFLTTLFPKIMPNFWRTGAPSILKIQWFPLSILIFGQIYCFLGPTTLKIPQPNWYVRRYLGYILFYYTALQFHRKFTHSQKLAYIGKCLLKLDIY